MVMDDLLCLNSGHLWLLSNQNPSHRTTYHRTCLSKTSFFASNSNSHHTLMPQNKKKIWVLRVLQMRSLWKPANNNHALQEMRDDDQDSCDACRVDDEDDKSVEFDKNSFSKLLSTVSLADARLYAKMAYLGTLSYTIPKIKLGNLLKRHKLCFVTSSLEKKVEVVAANPKKEQGDEAHNLKSQKRIEEENNSTSHDGITRAYEIAASYLHSHIFKSMKTNNSLSESEVGEDVNMLNAKDEMELEQSSSVADNNDLNSSTSSSPCEWFICDDNENNTRYFVIQGSESLASWQANLLFEPIQFEAEVDVIVHRGIYEAAKVVYEEILPRVHEHLQRHHNNNNARICLSGHSLGGSLSLLINLMLLIRGQVPNPCCLLPVITFGAPWVMCGGDHLLHKLGLPRNHLQGITTHRDIVPRAFSCNFPTRVAHLLKAVNGNFRNHPCLNNQNVLYAPMGELLILQPDAKVSPSHELLPSGSGLYVFRCEASEKQTRAAHSLFLNTPHPLHMILSDPSAAYASILRDHDVETYLKSIRSVIRQQLMIIRRRMRQRDQDVNVMKRWVKEMSTLLDDGLKKLRNQVHLIALIMESCNWMHNYFFTPFE